MSNGENIDYGELAKDISLPDDERFAAAVEAIGGGLTEQEIRNIQASMVNVGRDSDFGAAMIRNAEGLVRLAHLVIKLTA